MCDSIVQLNDRQWKKFKSLNYNVLLVHLYNNITVASFSPHDLKLRCKYFFWYSKSINISKRHRNGKLFIFYEVIKNEWKKKRSAIRIILSLLFSVCEGG